MVVARAVRREARRFRTVRLHHGKLRISISLTHEQDALTIWGPRRLIISVRVIRQPRDTCASRRHGIDLDVAVAARAECDSVPRRRPRRLGIAPTVADSRRL